MQSALEHYLVLPASGSGPCVVILPAWWGLNPFFKELCQQTAALGYVALGYDLYHGQTAGSEDEARRLKGRLNQQETVLEICSILKEISGRPEVRGHQLGVIGFSIGARFALELSALEAQLISAAVVFYGTNMVDYSAASAAYLGHFASSDPWCAQSGVQKLEKRLRAAGRPVSFFTYPETGHWFFEKDRAESYQEAAAELAWQRTAQFLGERLS